MTKTLLTQKPGLNQEPVKKHRNKHNKTYFLRGKSFFPPSLQAVRSQSPSLKKKLQIIEEIYAFGRHHALSFAFPLIKAFQELSQEVLAMVSKLFIVTNSTLSIF